MLPVLFVLIAHTFSPFFSYDICKVFQALCFLLVLGLPQLLCAQYEGRVTYHIAYTALDTLPLRHLHGDSCTAHYSKQDLYIEFYGPDRQLDFLWFSGRYGKIFLRPARVDTVYWLNGNERGPAFVGMSQPAATDTLLGHACRQLRLVKGDPAQPATLITSRYWYASDMPLTPAAFENFTLLQFDIYCRKAQSAYLAYELEQAYRYRIRWEAKQLKEGTDIPETPGNPDQTLLYWPALDNLLY